MRPLTAEESQLVFAKLAFYIGDSVAELLQRQDAVYVFRLEAHQTWSNRKKRGLHKDRVYYCSEKLLKMAACIGREPLLSFGTCIGKFTKTKKFYLHITALDYIAPYAKCRIWLKPNAEQQFLYGNNILKSGVLRMSEGAEKQSGVVVYSTNDTPLGFGVTAKGTAECKRSDPTALVLLHQADLGEYLRHEETLT